MALACGFVPVKVTIGGVEALSGEPLVGAPLVRYMHLPSSTGARHSAAAHALRGGTSCLAHTRRR